MKRKNTEVPNNKNTTDDIYKNIYSSYSYSNLTSQAQEKVNSVVEQFLKDGQMPDFLQVAPILFDTQPFAANSPSARKEVLRIGEELLTDTIPDDIFYEESEAKREVILQEQRFILFHYLSRYWAVLNKADAVTSTEAELAICYRNIYFGVKAIHLLERKLQEETDNFIKELKPLKPNIPNLFKGFLDKDEEQQDSDYALSLLRRANAIRLYWLWNRIVIELFVNTAHNLLLPMTIFADQVSWSLYLFLASIHITGVLGAYFDAKAREKSLRIEASRVALAHLKIRRDIIINDLIWGIANLACCFWLNGFGLFAYFGDLVTGILLGMDLGMSLWDYMDDKKRYEVNIKSYNEQLIALIQSTITNYPNAPSIFTTLENSIQNNDYDSVKGHLKTLDSQIKKIKDDKQRKELEIIYWKLSMLHAAKESCKNKWDEEKKMLLSNCFYAAALLVAFTVFCFFYLSILPISIPMSVIVFGAITLGATTLVWRSANSYMECSGIYQIKQNAIKEYQELIDNFINPQEELSLNQQKQLYLRILQKAAQVGYQEDKLFYTKLESLRETANRILIPASIAMAFLFLPASVVGIPTYVFLLLGILVATVATSMLIKKIYKPEDSKWIDKNGEFQSQPALIKEQFNEFKKFLSNENVMPVKEKKSKILDVVKTFRSGNNALMFSEETLSKNLTTKKNNRTDSEPSANYPIGKPNKGTT